MLSGSVYSNVVHTASPVDSDGLLEQIGSDSPRFLEVLVGEIQGCGRRFLDSSERVDERWSLVDCGIKESDWRKILDWARRCPASDCPRPHSWLGGMVLLLAGAAVSRNLEMDEPLWQTVAQVLSPQLRTALFGSGWYPLEEARGALSEVAKSLGLREQLDLPGKHRYWRTVQLQVGFSKNAGAGRLSDWLAGQGVPQVVSTLLSESDENGSAAFRALWKTLRHWSRHLDDLEIEKTLIQNPWYPASVHHQIKSGLTAARQSGVVPQLEAEGESVLTLLGAARLKNGAFQVDLSSYLPPEIATDPARVLRLHIEGQRGAYKLVHNPDGDWTLEDGPVRLSIRDAIDQPARAMRIVGAGGTVYQEQLELWAEDQEIVVFDGQTGQQVHDLGRFQPRTGRGYLLIARADVEVQSEGRHVEWIDRSATWCFYSFPAGFPPRFETAIPGTTLWAPEIPSRNETPFSGASCQIRELSLNRLFISVQPTSGWTVERIRFCGRKIEGQKGELQVSPGRQYQGKKAHVTFRKGDQEETVVLTAERAGEDATGAAYERGPRDWRLIASDRVLDAGEIEGKMLSVGWSEQEASDPWLTLGDAPLLAYPRRSRRQRFIACGEPLQLRFGLMNEETNYRMTFAPAVYSTGLLAGVSEAGLTYVLYLREPIEAVEELVLWVWEAGHPEPRKLDPNQVFSQADRQSIVIHRSSVTDPLGWAISLDGGWRGERFQFEPQSRQWPGLSERWCEILRREETWARCASALRWWRFPVMMDPFRKIVQVQASRLGLATLKAWTDPNSFFGVALTKPAAELYANPLRMFLWDYQPTSEESIELWNSYGDEVIAAFEQGRVSPACSLLLFSHPVLLVRIVSSVLWTRLQQLEAEVPRLPTRGHSLKTSDPARIQQIELDVQALFAAARDQIERHANIGHYPERARAEVLRAEALSDLRSWSDPRPLDASFFDEHIVRAAEAHFDGVVTDTRRLKIAIALSKACAAFLASHLLEKRGLRTTG